STAHSSLGNNGFSGEGYGSQYDLVRGPVGRQRAYEHGGHRPAIQKYGQMLNGARDGPSPPATSSETKRGPEEPGTGDSELASMRARYMGIAPQRTKKRRLNERKFVFDWSTDTDTTTPAVESTKTVN